MVPWSFDLVHLPSVIQRNKGSEQFLLTTPVALPTMNWVN
jgi:hypothetical protein